MLQNDIAVKLNNWLKNRNESTTLLTSAVRTTTQTSADLSNKGALGIVVTLDVTNVNTSSIVLTIQRKDQASGKYVTILTGAAVTAISTNTYKVYPGLTAAANLTVSDLIGDTFKIVVTVGNANNTTYTLGYTLI